MKNSVIRRARILPSTAIALTSLLGLSAVLLAVSTVPLDQAILAITIIWIASLPGLIYLQDYDRQPIPFLPFVGLYYTLFFGLPIFLKPFAYLSGDLVAVQSVVVLEPMRAAVLLLTIGGITALIAAFYFARYTFLRNMPHFRMPGSQVRAMELNILYGILMIGSLAFRFSPAIQSLPSIGQFLGPAGFVRLGDTIFNGGPGGFPAP